MKKFLSILLATMMVLAMVGTAFASDEAKYAITIENETAGYTYDAYRIFSGDLSEDKKTLTNIEWDSSVTTDAKSAAYAWAAAQLDTNPDDNEAPEVMTAAKVASAISNNNVADFAVLMATNKAATVSATSRYDETAKEYVIGKDESGNATLEAGYYLVVNSDIPEDGTTSTYIMELVDSVTVSPKTSTVSFEKKLKDINDSTDNTMTDWVDTADHDIGDVIPFQLKGTLPENYDAYAQYKYVFNDTMSKGLTPDLSSVKVYVGNTEVKSGFSVSESTTVDETTGAQKFEITFANLKDTSGENQVKDSNGDAVTITKDSVITVEYNATLNGNAVIGAAGNPNEAYLSYSNNPYHTGEGDTTSDTVEDKVIVFTYTVEINKVDDSNNALPGADFELYKYNINSTADEKWEKISYAETTPNSTFTFKGLDDGQYMLKEVTTPDGYNSIDEFYFTVSATHNDSTLSLSDLNVTTNTTATADPETGAITLSGNSENQMTATETTGEIEAYIKNSKGAELPSTGGIGTTLFYLFGGLMTAGSALMLVVRRRAEAEEE